MGYLWNPPSAHTIQAERPMSKPEAGQVRCRAHDGGNQKGVLSMWWCLARDMELDMYAEERVNDKGTITAMRSDLRPRFAIAIFLSRLAVVVVVVPPPPGLVSASCVTRCLSSWEAMGDYCNEERKKEDVSIWEKGNRKCIGEGLVLVIR
ncbi:hypothetical protein PIB30_003414 [Stylosanthes scabra]|uniref:Uncharacterized protein n=1 Tax=Stylosanthes scabra TaxID=79078 RepID=A0ABU6U2U8_9FABA|nr:hypothetical protein [Stylosanthes scabra]